MTSDAAYKIILDSFPTKLSRSRLEPYADLILELHRRGRSYREIVRILSERCDIRASRSTLNDFVRARIKRMRHMHKRGLHKPGEPIPGSASLIKISPTESRTANEEIQKRIAALKQRKTSIATDAKRFVYDPDQPLSILPPKSPEKK